MRARQAGFTLVELLVVLAIIAIATAGAMLSLRDTRQDALDREAARLAALLEAARAQARSSGLPVTWQATAGGFRFAGLPPAQPGSALATGWDTPVLVLAAGRLDALRSDGTAQLVLGPEPMLPPQQVTIALPERPDARRTIATDGLRPFAVHVPVAP